MFSRRNRSVSNKPKDDQSSERPVTDEIFDFNTSIGNQALIENLDLIQDNDHGSVLKSREADLQTHRPPRKRDNGENYKVPDMNSMGPETNVTYRIGEDKERNEILKPRKPEKSAKKEAAKPAQKKRFANENIITNEKKKPPLIGMPEKDPDSEDNDPEFILPPIQEKKRKKGIIEKNESKTAGLWSDQNILTEDEDWYYGDDRSEEGAGYEGMTENIPYEYWNSGSRMNDDEIILPLKPKKKGTHPKQKNKPKEDLIEGLADIAAEEIEKGPTYDGLPDPDMVANEAIMENNPDKPKKRSSLSESENIGNRIRGLSEMEKEEDRPRWKDAAGKRTHEMITKQYGGDADLEAREMQKVKDWNFGAQRMDDLKKPSWWRRFLTRTAVRAGKLLTVAGTILTGGLFWWLRGKNRSANEMNDMVLTRDHKSVPGWQEGAKFDSDKHNGQEIMSDFRRVPLVFSNLTAAPAVDDNGKPLDPVITVFIDQPKSNSEQAMKGMEIGHAMIGIEYSRKSKVTGKWERYSLQYGFYPAGSTTSTLSGGMMAQTRNAIVPGQLRDDSSHPYDISRRYPATVRQVNAILKASETYADKGYGYYDRNCTTFVKEMVVDQAHLATGGDIFKWGEVGFSNWANFGMFGGTMFPLNAQGGMETTMMDLAGKNDDTYQGYGNKRTTGKDYVNYRESLKNNAGSIKHTFIPAEVGEMMRRTNGPQAGELGSRKFAGTMRNAEDPDKIDVGFQPLKANLKSALSDFRTVLDQLVPVADHSKMPADLSLTLNSLYDIPDLMDEMNDKVNTLIAQKEAEGNAPYKYADAFTGDELRKNRADITKAISSVSIILQDYFNNDKRLHGPAMNIISLLNYAADYVDTMYREVRKGKDLEGDLGDIRDEMNHNTINVSAGGVTANFAPSHYESYIQIYKTPEAAVRAGARFVELKRKEERREKLTATEEKELKRLTRLNRLAMDFDSSHRYLLEKDEFSQQDVDYVFQLRSKEKQGAHPNNGPVAEYKTASGIYLSLMLEKIFSGMKQQWNKNGAEGGIDEESVGNPDVVKVWLDDFLTPRAHQKIRNIAMILRGIKRSMDDPTDEQILEEFKKTISGAWIDRNFDPKSLELKTAMAPVVLPMGFDDLLADGSSGFGKIIKDILKILRDEDKAAAIEKPEAGLLRHGA